MGISPSAVSALYQLMFYSAQRGLSPFNFKLLASGFDSQILLGSYTFARNISMYIFFNIVTSYVSLAYKLMGKLFHLKEINLFFKTLPKRTKKNLN
jgi:hypothetical protein